MAELPTHLSPSSATAYEGCARRWKFKYVDRQREPSGQAALVGSFAHRVLELLCEFPAVERTLDQAKIVAKQQWPEFEQDEDYQLLELDQSKARAFRWQAWLAVSGLWDLEDPAKVEVVATEQKVNVALDGVPFVGIVDRVDRDAGKLVVSDYKSGALPGERWRKDKVQQVMLYAAALWASTGELPDRTRLLYLGQRILDVRVTEQRIEESVADLSRVWDQMAISCDTDTFEPNTTVLCGWCPFVNQCPEGQAEIDRRIQAGTLPAHAPAGSIALEPLVA